MVDDLKFAIKKEKYSCVQFKGEENREFVCKFTGKEIKANKLGDTVLFFTNKYRGVNAYADTVEVHIGDWFVKDGEGKCELLSQKDFNLKYQVVE